MNVIKMEDLFKRVGLDYKTMQINEPYDISDKNIKIKSFNHEKNKNEFKRILSVVRKEDSTIYKIVTKTGEILLKGSGAHKIFNIDTKQYDSLRDLKEVCCLNNNGDKIQGFVIKTEETEPIVDLEVEGNKNYFTNGILSHNTTAGGNALKFYSSIRLKFSKIGVNEEGTGDDKEKVSIRVRAEAVKNKTAPPFKRCEYIVTFGKGIDNEASIIEAIIEKGIVTKKGAWISYNGNNIAQGITKFKELLSNNKELYEEMKMKLDNMLKSGMSNNISLNEEEFEENIPKTEEEFNKLIEEETEIESGEI